MRLTVFVITRARPRLLKRCVRSVLSQLGPEDELRVLVNGPHGETERWLGQQSHPGLHWRTQEEEHRTICRNRAFVESRGDIIYFLDDDVVLPPGGMDRVAGRFGDDANLVVLGGPNLTPPESSWAQRVFGAVMTSPVAAPMVRVRYGGGARELHQVTERELVLCNLAVRRDRIPPWLRFPPHYLGNEENIFLYYCKRRGLKLGFDPQARVYHARRATLKGFFHQVFYYGAGRAQQTLAAPRSLHPLFLAPPLLVGAVLAMTLFAPRALWGLGIYVGIGAVGAVVSMECRSLGWRGCLAVGVLTPLAHLFYGFGFWWGTIGGVLGLSKAQHVRPPVVPASERFSIP